MQPCVIRFNAAEIGEIVVLHCHKLKHEDTGAMGLMRVNGGTASPTTNPVVEAVNCSDNLSCGDSSCSDIVKKLFDLSSNDDNGVTNTSDTTNPTSNISYYFHNLPLIIEIILLIYLCEI